MPWLCAIIETAEESVEILSDALMEVGALAVDVQDAAAGTDEERPIFAEPGEAPAAGWRSNRVGARARFVWSGDLCAPDPVDNRIQRRARGDGLAVCWLE